MRIVLVRHGESLWNVENRYQGQSQVALSPRGMEQACAVARAVVPMEPVALYTSPLRRALDTAVAIGQTTGFVPQKADGLMELNLGELEGLPFAEFPGRYPELREQWFRDASTVLMPGGESLAQLQERAWVSVQEIVEAYPGDPVVVAVSHGFAIRTVLCRLLGVPLSHFRLFHMDYASVTVLEFQDAQGRVVTVNNCSHLADDAWKGAA